ncbi:MAG: succinate dehydrogenase, hydrophobic membrane anchor protein [Steroidobacteraceae bacterium]
MSQGPVGALLKYLGRDPGHAGAHHWRAQRVSALALIPLTIWFLSALAWLPDFGFDTVHAWAATPWRAVLLSLLVFCIAWHSQLGMQVFIEDYVHGNVSRPLAVGVSTFAHVLLGAAGMSAALCVAFRG